MLAPKRFAWIGLASMLSGLNAMASALTLTTEDYPPFNIKAENGKPVSGIATDIIAEMMKRAAIPITIAMYPWERAKSLALSDGDTCVYSMVRNEKRENQYKWVGPVVSDDWALFAPQDSRIMLKTLEDARQYKLGGYHGDAAGDYLLTRKFQVDIASSDKMNPQKLAAGRIDLWIAGTRTGPFVASREGVRNIKPIFVFGEARDYQMYLACHKNVPDATINQLNGILKQMQGDGTIHRIHGKYE